MFNRIAVLGVGAIGGIIGGYLARSGHDVTLIDQWPANVEAIRKKGLTVSTQEGDFTVAGQRRPPRRGVQHRRAVRPRIPRDEVLRYRMGNPLHPASPVREWRDSLSAEWHQ